MSILRRISPGRNEDDPAIPGCGTVPSPFILDLLRETLEFLEGEFSVLSDPPATTREAQAAILCCRLRYALTTYGSTVMTQGLTEPETAVDSGDDWELDPFEPEGEEYRPYGWTPALWDEWDRHDRPDVDAAGHCFTDADPGL